MKLRFKDYLLLSALKLVSMLPYRFIYGLGYFLGGLAYYRDIKPNRIIRTNISRCFPELHEQEREKLIKQAMRHSVIRVIEMAFFWFAPIKRILRTIKVVEGEHEASASIEKKGVGILVMHLHHGGWEILNCYFGNRYEISALYKPPKDAFQEKLLKRARERLGKTRMYPISMKGIKNIMDDLKAGGKVGISPDHEPADDNGVFAPLFNIPCLTMTLVNKLAKKANAEAYITYAVRLPGGRGFAIKLNPIGKDFYSNDILVGATALNKGIEQAVRLNPEQYEWTYKRFKKRPPGSNEGKFYRD